MLKSHDKKDKNVNSGIGRKDAYMLTGGERKTPRDTGRFREKAGDAVGLGEADIDAAGRALREHVGVVGGEPDQNREIEGRCGVT